LTGTRVTLLGNGVAHAFAGKWLAALGAEVIKVEPPGGDRLRRESPSGEVEPGTLAGALASYLYTGFKSVSLDLETAGGRQTVRNLCLESDVVVHGLHADEAAVFGLDTAGLQAARPELIVVVLSAFGSGGPYDGFAATPNVLLALGGYQFLTGEPGREPLMLPGKQAEYLTGLYGAACALAGVLGLLRQGRGRQFEVTALETLASLHQFTTSMWLYQGIIRSRHGNRWQNLYPITMLPCSNGYMAMSITTPDMWSRLCAMLGRPEMMTDPRFVTPIARHAHADALDEILVDYFRDRGKMELFREAQAQWRLPMQPYFDVGEVLTDPQLKERRFWAQPGGCALPAVQPGLPVSMSVTPWLIGPVPKPGEQTDEVMARLRSGAPRRRAVQNARRTDDRAAAADATVVHPLAGITVLDFTRVWSGPLSTRILADLGARVIKVEAPMPPAFAGPGGQPGPAGAFMRGGGMQKLNRNKLSIAVDLHLAKGRDLIRRLVPQSDVVVENFSVRVMPNLGLDYDSLRRLNPRLVMLSLSGFGTTGPYRNDLAYGSATEAITGINSLLGYSGEEPLNTAIAYPDPVAGLTGACAVLAALAYRERTGEGQYIDHSQVEGAIGMIGEYLVEYQQGRRPERTGNRHPDWAPHGTYRCRGEDEWLSLAVRDDEEWRRFCAVAGLDQLVADPDYASAAGRRGHRAALDAAIGAWALGLDKWEAMEKLQRAGVPAGAVANGRELVENLQLAHRDFFVHAMTGNGELLPMPGTPITIDDEKPREWRAAPARGEHNRMVLRDVFGVSEDEIDALEGEGVLVGGAPVLS
jgi:crotonobetainyl-CoA:carnitine CoA-transferase CaiB-like acyl-CoA transferase